MYATQVQLRCAFPKGSRIFGQPMPAGTFLCNLEFDRQVPIGQAIDSALRVSKQGNPWLQLRSGEIVRVVRIAPILDCKE